MPVLMLFALLVSTCAAADEATDFSQESWRLHDAQGKPFDFPTQAIEKKQVTLLLFWATWCPYCKQLMPHIQSALYQYEDSLNLQVLALNINEDGDPQAYLQSQGYSFEMFPEAEAVAKQYQVYGTPAVLIFDQQGELVFDLRSVQSDHLVNQKASHGAKSVRKAPYWAAAIRKALQGML